MKTDFEKMVGICGIYCGSCPHYLAYRKNDTAMMEKMSRESGYSVEEICCEGCLSNKVAADCVDCGAGFRRCAAEKQVRHCYRCDDFPCKRLKDFADVHIVNGISHHEHILEENAYLREHGIDSWVAKQAAAAKCGGCGEVLYWHIRECGNCHAKVR